MSSNTPDPLPELDVVAHQTASAWSRQAFPEVESSVPGDLASSLPYVADQEAPTGLPSAARYAKLRGGFNAPVRVSRIDRLAFRGITAEPDASSPASI